MEVSLATLGDFAKHFVTRLPTQISQRAHVVWLSGPLGAGKTTFVQHVAKALGILEDVPSPTFTLMRAYPILHDVFKKLIHIDAYRLSPSEIDIIGWESYLADPENLVLIEWPENMPGGRKPAAMSLEFKVLNEEEREIIEKNL